MTAIMNRPDIPKILPPKHARPSRLRVLTAVLLDVATFVCAMALFVGMCEEVGEAGFTGDWTHLAVGIVGLVGLVQYGARIYAPADDERAWSWGVAACVVCLAVLGTAELWDLLAGGEWEHGLFAIADLAAIAVYLRHVTDREDHR